LINKSFFNRKDAKSAKKEIETDEDEKIIKQETTEVTERGVQAVPRGAGLSPLVPRGAGFERSLLRRR
jgi:hypothetical protein